ncbi:MAG: RNA 2',3'-cyclic phosphodiesterase [Pseudobdellovibrionaceae bacterium]
MASKRLFIGIHFSEKFANELLPWIKKIRKTADQKEIGLKWTPAENLHVTLVFLGPTSEEQIPDIESKIEAVILKHSTFDLKIRGIGGFPELHRARVIYLNVQRSQKLLDLQSDLERELKDPSEFEPDYSPHLTLARLRNPKSCRDLLSPFEKIDLGKQGVSEVILYESHLAGAFPVYEMLRRFPLPQDFHSES